MAAYSCTASAASSDAWTKIPPDFMFTIQPGTYLLRKDRWADPKYHATLTGIYDGFSGRVKFVFDERDDVPYEWLLKYVMEETGGRDIDTLHRKVYMASFKFKCAKYNERLESCPVRSEGEMIRLQFENSLAVMLASLNKDLLLVFDSYMMVRKDAIGQAWLLPDQGGPGPSKRKANDEPDEKLNEKRMRMN